MFSNWKKAVGIAAFAFVISSGKVLAACTEGPGWTPEEFAEYQSLNDTTSWPGLAKLTHCTADDLATAQTPGRLAARSGQRQWQGFGSNGCTGQKTAVTSGFGCGVCVTASSFPFESGWLWREGTGNPYPTADYYTKDNCKGSKIFHQGINSGAHTSCNNVVRANSVILYQGC